MSPFVRYSLMIILLFSCWTSCFGQELTIEGDIVAEINGLRQRTEAAIENDDWELVTELNDAAEVLVLRQTLSASYLEDKEGEVWNLGVLDMPFIIHGIVHVNTDLFNIKIDAINEVAEATHTQVMHFLLMPRPSSEPEHKRLAMVNEHVIVVYSELTDRENRVLIDNRLLQLLNYYPVTFFISADRRIRGIHTGALMPRAADEERNIGMVTAAQAHKQNVKRLEKGTLALLRGRRIRGQ